MAWYLAYNYPLSRGYIAVTVLDGGPSWLLLRGPWGDPSEIGTFHGPLPDATVKRLQATVKAADYKNLPTGGPAQPETPFVTIGEGETPGPPDMRGFPLPTRPPEIQPIVDEMVPIIAELRKAPHHIARARGMWDAPSFRSKGQLVARVRLVNAGPHPAEFYNPAVKGAEMRAYAVLSVGRELPPDQFDEERDLQETDLRPDELSALDANGNAITTPTIQLPPGGAAEIVARKKVFLTPGPYRGTLTFDLIEEGIDHTVRVCGTLLVQLGVTSIQK